MSYRIPSHVLRARLDDDEVLLNPDTGMYHLLEDGGAQIVDSLEAGAGVEAVVGSIAEATGEDAARVRADVEKFIRELLERGLLEEIEPS